MPLDNSPNTRLEAAFAGVTAAQTRLDKIDSLIQEHEPKSWDARRAMRDCEIALNVAKENESRDTVAALLDNTATPGKSVSDCERDFEEARVDYENVRRLLMNLAAEKEVTERQLRDAKIKRDEAIRAILNNNPNVVALYQKIDALQGEMTATMAAASVVFKSGGNPRNFRSFPVIEGKYDTTLRDAWATAIKRLAESGEAEFPQ
jgi:chromosome segregation ATPase